MASSFCSLVAILVAFAVFLYKTGEVAVADIVRCIM